MSAITAAFRDGSIVARRNVLNVRRTPGALVTGIAQPIIFVLILAFVFGGALGGADYRQFLIGGILAQTLTFNSSFTAVYLAKDLQSGLIDRLRTLPMSRVGVILGRTSSDLVTSIISIAVILTCGLAIGWRVESGPLQVLVAFSLLLLFAFATSWIGATIALTAKSVEVAQNLGLLWLFPVCFISGADLSLSSSTSAGRVLVAIADPADSIGVDIETVPRQLWPEFDTYALHPEERLRMLSIGAPSGIGARIGAWTAKEAALKVSGSGLRTEPSSLRVDEHPDPEHAGWHRVHDAPALSAAAPSMCVTALAVGGNARASLASNRPQEVRLWRMPELLTALGCLPEAGYDGGELAHLA